MCERDLLIAKLRGVYSARQASGEGCGSCAYCNLGAVELCRHYDLDLMLMAYDDRAALRKADPQQ